MSSLYKDTTSLEVQTEINTVYMTLVKFQLLFWHIQPILLANQITFPNLACLTRLYLYIYELNAASRKKVNREGYPTYRLTNLNRRICKAQIDS